MKRTTIIAQAQAVIRKDGSVDQEIAQVSVNLNGDWHTFVTGINNIQVRDGGKYAIVTLSPKFEYKLEKCGTYDKATGTSEVHTITGADLKAKLEAERKAYTLANLKRPSFATE